MHHVRRAALGATAALALTIGIAVGGTAGVAVAATPSADATPSLAQQNATADHVMGATETGATATPLGQPTVGIPGFDVSYYQGDDSIRADDGTTFADRVQAQVADGAKFAFIKSTEGTPGTSPSGNTMGSLNSRFATQYADLQATNLLVGVYHYALPYYSSGPTQARFFLDHSPTWTAGAKSLPPVLDMEVNTVTDKQGGECWGLSQSDMVSWIQGWIATVVAADAVQPIIYTNPNFWNDCTGGSAAFPKDRLWVASYSGTATSPVSPAGLNTWSFWQWGEGAPVVADPADTAHSISSPNPDVFNGTASDLQALTTPSARAVGRISGGSAYETSANIAASAYTPSVTLDSNAEARTPGSIDTAYVATRLSYPDALSAAAAAGHQGAPVLLTDPNALSAATKAELAQLQPSHIVLVGGPTAITDTVLTQLQQSVPGRSTDVQRVYGASRYETSAAVASAFAPSTSGDYPNGLTAYVATGTDFPDALAGAAVAASSSAPGPMLLVQPNAVPTAIVDAITRLKPTRIIVLGGEKAVQPAVYQQLATYVGGQIDRWSGADRFDTSVVIAQHAFGAGAKTAFVATGTNFPDALAGGPAAGYFDAPVLLTRPDAVPDDVRTELSALGAKGVVVLGGPSAVNAAVEASF
jgi:putative cell wall-binding protein/GH25 family lysozyme M1 (1,4-beta-N-acetylmuramidase)